MPTSVLRTTGYGPNIFAVESFVDELAHRAGADPLRYRQKLLRGSPRALKILQVVAERSGWERPPAAGRHRGVAFCEAFGTYIGHVVELSVAADKRVTIDRIVAAVDPGIVLDPDITVNAIEGGAAWGLSAAFLSEIRFDRGRTVQSNFDDYPILRPPADAARRGPPRRRRRDLARRHRRGRARDPHPRRDQRALRRHRGARPLVAPRPARLSALMIARSLLCLTALAALAAAAHAAAAPTEDELPDFAVAGPAGFGVVSADGASMLAVHWLLEADFRSFVTDSPEADRDTFVTRFAGLRLDTILARSFRAQLFANLAENRLTVLEAWIEAKLAPWARLRAGKFQFPITEERLTPGTSLPFVSTSPASLLLPARDTGVQLLGTVGPLSSTWRW